jgi:hypothetical protein
MNNNLSLGKTRIEEEERQSLVKPKKLFGETHGATATTIGQTAQNLTKKPATASPATST